MRNSFLTKIDSRQGFVNCVKANCARGVTNEQGGLEDDILARVMDCVGLEEGMGPGPARNWLDFKNKQKMMIMQNRGKLGFCLKKIKCRK